MAVVLPGVPETDVGEADAAPGEEGGKTGQRLQPVESDGTTCRQGHESQGRPHDDEQSGEQRTAGTVDVAEEAGGVALLGKSAECAGATVDTGKTDRDDGKHDDDVGEVGEADDTGSLGNDDEGRGCHIDVAAVSEESLVGVVDKETDEGKRQDVEEGDTPEHLLDRRGEGLAGVFGFSCSETDELSSREGESCGDEHSTEADKGGESAGVLPPLTTLVFGEAVMLVSNRPIVRILRGDCLLSAGGTTTADEDDTHEQEDNDCGELQQRDPELFLGVSENTEHADDDDGEGEDGDPYGKMHVGRSRPPLDCETGDHKFERKDDCLDATLELVRVRCSESRITCPLEDVVPSHGKAPGRIDEADRVRVETTGDREQDGQFTESVDDVDHHLGCCQSSLLKLRTSTEYSRNQ